MKKYLLGLLSTVSVLVFVFSFITNVLNAQTNPTITITEIPTSVVRGEQAQIKWTIQGELEDPYVRVQVQNSSGEVIVNSSSINHKNHSRWNWNTNKSLTSGTYKVYVYSHPDTFIRSAPKNIIVKSGSDTAPIDSITCTIPTGINPKVGDTVTRNISVTGGTGIYEYEWDGTDTLSGSSAKNDKVYDTVGTKTASVKITTGTIERTFDCLDVEVGPAIVTPAPAFFTRNLVPGSTDVDVTHLQNFLISQGHLKEMATGYFGEKTKAALILWQTANNILPAEGDFGPISRAKMNTIVTSAPPLAIPALTATCSVSSQNVTTGQTVTRQASYVGGGNTIATYQWTGDGGLPNSSHSSISHSYTNAGTNIASVKVTVGAQTVTAPCNNVTVTAASVTPTETEIGGHCTVFNGAAQIGGIVRREAFPNGGLGSGTYSYAWQGDESLTGDQKVNEKQYGSVGTKNAKVVVTSGTKTKEILCLPAEVSAATTPVATLNIQSIGATSAGITSTSHPEYGGTTPYTETSASNISSVILKAEPTSGTATFASWTGDCTSTSVSNRTCTVSVNTGSTKTVKANYTAPASVATLHVKSENAVGVVIESNKSNSFGGNTNYTEKSTSNISGVTLTAAENPPGSGKFTSWTGDCASTNASNRTCTVSVNTGSTKTVTANYADLTVCNAQSLRVCGVNGQTYSNSCQATAASVAIAYTGACLPLPTITLGTIPTTVVRGEQARITWTKQGNLPGSFVRVQILDANNKEVAVSTNINHANYDRWNWNTSSSLPTGTYRVKVYTVSTVFNQPIVSDVKSISIIPADVNIVNSNQFETEINGECTLTSPTSPNVVVGQQITREVVSLTGGSGSGAYLYAWQGDESLSGNQKKVEKKYDTVGTKIASVKVTSGTKEKTIVCTPVVVSVAVATPTQAPAPTPAPTPGPTPPTLPTPTTPTVTQCYSSTNAAYSACCDLSNGGSLWQLKSNSSWSRWTGASNSCTKNINSYKLTPSNSIVPPSNLISLQDTSSPIIASEKSIKPGEEGKHVTALQTALQQIGVYTGPITGYFGDLTKNAVSSFQSANSLEAVGEVGPKTRALLNFLLSR